MKAAVEALGRSWGQIVHHLWTVVLANLFAVLLSLPCIGLLDLLTVIPHTPGVSVLAVGLLFILLPTPTVAGLQMMMRHLAHDLPVSIGDVWEGLISLGPTAVKV